MSISRKICAGISALALAGSLYGGIKSWNAREEADAEIEKYRMARLEEIFSKRQIDKNPFEMLEAPQELSSRRDWSTAGLIGCSAGLFASAIIGAYFLLIDGVEKRLTYP